MYYMIVFCAKDWQMFSLKGHIENISGFGKYGLHHDYSISAIACHYLWESSCRQYIKECPWLYSNTNLLINTAGEPDLPYGP